MQWKVLQMNVTHMELCWQESPREKYFLKDHSAKKKKKERERQWRRRQGGRF